MRESWNWTEADLNGLVKNAQPETIELDYKDARAVDRSEKFINDLSKDVSAFANSAGGTLVFGIPENKATRLPQGLGPGVETGKLDLDWIDQRLDSSIKRRIAGIRFKRVALTNHPGTEALVIYVPRSNAAPHQANDKLFYKRFETRSVPMEEYEVRDLYLRGEAPDLESLLHLGQPRVEYFVPNSRRRLQLHLRVSNRSVEPAANVVIRVAIDQRLLQESSFAAWRSWGSVQMNGSEAGISLATFEFAYNPSHGNPLSLGTNYEYVFNYLDVLSPIPTEAIFFVACQLVAPKAEPRARAWELVAKMPWLSASPAKFDPNYLFERFL